MVRGGTNVMLIDGDGPNVQKWPKGREATREAIDDAINDESKPFGHAWACALALLEDLGQ
jgi:hypothetical protein